MRMPLSGDSVVALAVGLPSPNDLLVDNGALYVSASGHIKKMSTRGGELSEVAAIEGSMVRDGGSLYVTTGASVERIDLATGAVTTLAVGQHNSWNKAVTDANHIYWLNSGNHYDPPLGTLNRIEKN